MENYISEKTWEEFQNSGLLWFINSILHLFGWAICIEYVDKKVVRVYPARVRFRGFSESINTEGYKKITSYLLENIDELNEEI